MMTSTRADWQRYAARWAAQYGGYDLRRAPGTVQRWQQAAYGVGRVLALLRVPPVAVTVLGVATAVAVIPLADPAGLALLGASGLVLLGAFLAAVDTAMGLLGAPLPRTASIRRAVAGRIRELGWLIGFWTAGVAGPLLVACGVLTGLHEYVRVQALAAGMSRIGAQTAGDRPMRVGVAVTGLALAALAGPRLAAGVLTLAGVAWLALAALGLGQLLGAVRRSLG